jgi:hypothetical protein
MNPYSGTSSLAKVRACPRNAPPRAGAASLAARPSPASNRGSLLRRSPVAAAQQSAPPSPTHCRPRSPPAPAAANTAQVLRFAAVGTGLVYGSVKLGYLKGVAAKNAKKAGTAAEGAH